MIVRFWGVRGSIPTPISPRQIRGKIAAAVSRITSADLETPEAREAFLATLPPEIFGTVGGDTTCIEVRLSDDTVIVFDAGSGITKLARSLKSQRSHKRQYHLFFTHFHWDHIQGLPFFAPQVYDPDCEITFYSPVAEIEEILRGQMSDPYFPVTLDEMKATLRFVTLDRMPVQIGGAKVYWRRVKHPGTCYSYKVVENGRSFIFSTDTELDDEDFKRDSANESYYANVNLMAMDAQYTLNEAIEKYDWGHSSYSLAVDFAAEWEIERLVLFHHDPQYDDSKMYSILKSAHWYRRHLHTDRLSIHLARESSEFEV